MSILVLGGAGYIGSNVVDMLVSEEYDVIVIDNLCTGFRQSIHTKAKFYEGDIRDKEFLRTVFQCESITSVMYFAALSNGRESVTNPLKYFNNNIYGTQIILEIIQEFKVKYLVFSSSAAVYGNTSNILVDEQSPTKPLNPYGYSKIMMETMIKSAEPTSDMTYIALRYFNVAGAKKDGTLGEVRPRLIPIALQVAQNKREKMIIYGNNFNTPDGTCIRDYIHVRDLAESHIAALKYLEKGNDSEIFNVGTAKGYSNLEIIDAVRTVTGKNIPIDFIPDIGGDADILIASNKKIRRCLNWEPKYSEIEEIISDAWRWQNKFPNGYLL